MRWLSLLSVFFFFTLPSLAFGQDPPTLKPYSTTTSTTKSQPLALQIFINPTMPPAYLPVYEPDLKPRWIWTSRFAKIPGWQSPPGAKLIHAVRIACYWNGETAEVKVSLLRGAREMDVDEPVSTHRLGLGESIVVSELETHGVQAFRIKLISAKVAAPPMPNLENRTSSIEVLKITPESDPLPAYRVTFRNLSAKEVVALRVNFVFDGAPGTSALFQAETGRPLIESNAVSEQYIAAHVSQNLGTSYEPGISRASLMQVTSAVFADGSFEGNVSTACSYEMRAVSRIKWLRSMLSLLDEYTQKNLDEPEVAQEFRQRVLDENFSYSAAEKATPSKVSERCPSPARGAENLTKGFSLKLINDLDVINTRGKSRLAFRSWVESARKTYREWLASLEFFRRGPEVPQ